MSAWYPRREAFFADAIDVGRPVFQGDIFRGVPTAFLGHPAARAAAFAMERAPSPEAAERSLAPEEIRAVAIIAGSYTMVLPHPCDFSAGEKGETHTVRQVARLTRIADTRLARKHIEGGRVNHSVWVPAWDSGRPDDDWLVDLRTSTAVDAAYLNPARRVAAVGVAAWIALMRRLAFFYTHTVVDDVQLAVEQAHQHPDCPAR